MFDNFISSPQNPKVKRLMALQQKSSARREDSLFVVEGLREVERCIEAGYELDSLFCCPSLMQGSLAVRDEASTFEVSPEVYARIAYRGTTEGVIAIVRMRHLGLESLRLPKDPLLVVLESVEKPGNLGAVLRTADAARVDAVIVCDPLTDLFNPNLIRSSLGAFFTVPCVACSSAECIAFLRQRGVQILTAQLQDSRLCAVPPPSSWAPSPRGSPRSGARPPTPTYASPCWAEWIRSMSLSAQPSLFSRPSDSGGRWSDIFLVQVSGALNVL